MRHLGNIETCVAAGEGDVAACRDRCAKAHAAAFDNTDHGNRSVADRAVTVEYRIVFRPSGIGLRVRWACIGIPQTASTEIGPNTSEQNHIRGLVRNS